MTFRFLGHPSLDELELLKQYLRTRYEAIGPLIEATQAEIDALRKTLAKYTQAEGMMTSENFYDKETGLERYVTAPVLNEDLSHFERFKFDNAQTAEIVNKLIAPFESNLRARDRIGYKLKKILYLIEQKSLQIQILEELQEDFRDDING